MLGEKNFVFMFVRLINKRFYFQNIYQFIFTKILESLTFFLLKFMRNNLLCKIPCNVSPLLTQIDLKLYKFGMIVGPRNKKKKIKIKDHRSINFILFLQNFRF
ncbi:hypothetical protein HanRHA438_Chr17g0838671 [Helianthus annuus]|nr:hypothetical protein HanRHA438_Chr17g0838671 [Helianthus annuus]